MTSFPFKNIGVVVEGSDASMQAAKIAIELARAADAKLTAVSVIDTETLRALLSSHILVDEERKEFEVELEESNRRYLERVTEMAHKVRQEAQTVLLRGSFHSSILHEMKRKEFDLVIIGFATSGTTKRDLMTHERELLMNDATCPLLLVKAV